MRIFIAFSARPRLSALALLAGSAMAANAADVPATTGRNAPIASSYVGDASFARELRKDPLVDKAIQAMLAFQRASWEQGVAAQALLEAGEQASAMAMARASLVYVSRDGVVAASGGSSMDPLMLGDTLLWAAGRTGDSALRKAADDMLRYALEGAPRAGDGTLYHQSLSGQIWSDESFTAPPFLASAGKYDEAIAQLRGIFARLWDPKAKLMHHIWSERENALVDSSYWGGGNGWTAAALARAIRSLPPERIADREQLAAMLRNLLDGCLAHQRPDGLFHNEPDNPDSFVETDLASMLGFAIYESVRGGWISEAYLPAADRMRAAVRAKVDRYGFVQGVAGAPGFDRPGISTEGEAFFILMETAARKAGRPLPPSQAAAR